MKAMNGQLNRYKKHMKGMSSQIDKKEHMKGVSDQIDKKNT